MTPSLPDDTERLQFRPLEMTDVDELVALHEDPLAVRFLGSHDRAWMERLIRMVDEEWAERGHGRIAIVERESGRFLGRTGLKYWQQFDETEVSWLLHADARGKGYATEAGAAALRWGFERFEPPYLTAMIQPDNAASLRVAERLGMSPIRTDRLLGDEVIVHAVAWASPAFAPWRRRSRRGTPRCRCR
jgi:RimJ/RimL family protein N-acetyltransferase